MKKWQNIFLLVGVVIIWGLLIYKFISAFSTTNDNTKNFAPPSSFIAPKSTPRDTFSLTRMDRDPFLGTIGTKSKPFSKPRTDLNKNPTEDLWPSIEYQGIVSDRNSSMKVYLISINGVQYPLKEGDAIDEIKIVLGTTNDVVLKFQGKTKKFLLK